jgi:tetratricopeptide (TPR) repeat protein
VEGPDHPEFSEALLNLAIAQRACGRLTPARATLAELLQIRHEHRFPADSSEAETWNFLGDIDLDENQLGAAEEAFKKSFEIYRSLPGDHRSNLANVLAGQAQARRRRTDLIGALALARRSLELTRASEGDKGPSFAESLTAVAELLQQEGQFHRAELAYLQALKLLSGPGWQHHTDKARVVIGLGSLLVETNRAGEAQPYLEDGLSIRWQAHLGNDAETARAESELGACYTALGDGRARARLEHAYQRLLDLQGSNHPDTRKAMDRLRRLGTSAG